MRAIEIDTDVFSRICAHHAEGEETENDILRRLLLAAPRRAKKVTNIQEADSTNTV